MTVAAIIEIGAGGHSGPEQSLPGAKATGKAHGSGWGGAVGVSASTSSVPATASFRSSWQSMLASLDAGLASTGKEGAAADENTAATEGHSIKSARSESAAASPISASASRRSNLVSAQQIAMSGGEKNLSHVGTGAGISVSQTAREILRRSAAGPVSKSATRIQPEDNAGNTHSAGTAKSAKLEAAPGEAASATNFATVQSIPVAMPAPVAEVEPSNTIEAPTQTTVTDFTPNSIQYDSPFSDGPATVTAGTGAVRNQTAGTFDGAESLSLSHPNHSGAAANLEKEGTAEAEEAQLPHTNDLGASNLVKGATGSQVMEVTAAAPAVQEKASTVHDKTSQAAAHGGMQNKNNGEIESTSANGLAAPTAAEELLSLGGMRPQAESTAHSLTEGSQSRLQAQPAIQSVKAIASPVGSGVMAGDAMSNAASSQSAPVPDTAPIPGKAGAASNSKATTVQAGSRMLHTEAAVHGDRQGQAVPAVLDGENNAALARDPAGGRAAVNLSGESTGAASKDGMAARDTFAALDAESSSGTSTWVHAGTRSAEAGFHDPALGWVGVRADASGGGVHASLVPGSTEAAVTLGGHLAGLNAYLKEQHTPVESLTLAATEEGAVSSSMGQGAHQSMHQDSGQGATSGQQSSTQVSAPVLTATAGREVAAASGRTEQSAQAFVPGGTHISVMA